MWQLVKIKKKSTSLKRTRRPTKGSTATKCGKVVGKNKANLTSLNRKRRNTTANEYLPKRPKLVKQDEILKEIENAERIDDPPESQFNQKQSSKTTTDNNNNDGLDVLPNGLINSVSYYITSKSYYVQIGLYSYKINHPLIQKQFQISARHFSGVVSTNGWVDGQVIDAYTVTHMDELEANVTYLPTDIGCSAIGNFWEKRIHSSSKIYNISTSLKGKLLIPYFAWSLETIDSGH